MTTQAPHQDILDTATKLGRMISESQPVTTFHSLLDNLKQDKDAQRLLDDLNGLTEKLAEKEGNVQPIEVEEKQQLEQMRTEVAQHPLLSKLQVAQMDYVDLMRQVDEAVTNASQPEG